MKDLTSDCKLLGDTIGTVGEITVLVKFSPKREKMLGDINENVEGLDQEGLEVRRESLDKLCATHWTVRANCFQKIIDQYDSLQQLWDLCLQEKLTTDVRCNVSMQRCMLMSLTLPVSHVNIVYETFRFHYNQDVKANKCKRHTIVSTIDLKHHKRNSDTRLNFHAKTHHSVQLQKYISSVLVELILHFDFECLD